MFNNLRTHLLMSPSSRRERRSWGCHNNPETADSNVSKTCIHILSKLPFSCLSFHICFSTSHSVCGVHLIPFCVQMEFNWFRDGNLFRQEKCKECQWSTKKKKWKKEVTAETFPSMPLYTFSIQLHALQTGYLLSFRALKGIIKLYFFPLWLQLIDQHLLV